MPEPIVIPSVAAIPDFVGTDLGVSNWVTIDQAQINAFAEATGDRQWIHVDVERARRESPFGGTIAHGYLTVSLASTLLPELVRVENSTQIINYGIDKLRLREPVPAGSRLRLGGTFKGVRMLSSGAAHTTIALRWEVEGARRPVCLADAIFVYFP